MLLAILSDTHNHSAHLLHALEICRAEGAGALLHCGDVTSPATAGLLAGFKIWLTFGNGDVDEEALRATLGQLDADNWTGMVWSGEIGGVPIAATHGHLDGKVAELVASGRYRYVFHGHSHRRQDELHGATRLVNPGALGGLRGTDRSFCLLDLSSQALKFIPV
ncbi:MAG: metallophosphoesterase family protein [Anaerolineaceae bacterium]|nr:metallophosphoesterase family protein [Anaerolineaceae bacterium]